MVKTRKKLGKRGKGFFKNRKGCLSRKKRLEENKY